MTKICARNRRSWWYYLVVGQRDLSQDRVPRIVMRIPGRWESPDQLAKALPAGYRLTRGRLHMPDGDRLDVIPRPPDRKFPKVFANACRRAPSARDRDAVKNYTANMCMASRGGSIDAAWRMIRAAEAVVRAGAAGVFIDNSGVAHGSDAWLEICEQPDEEAALWAYVLAVRGEEELWSLGMQVFGLRDVAMPRSGDDEQDAYTLHTFLHYTMVAPNRVADGDLLADEEVARFRAQKEEFSRFPPGNPMHNPYGVWRLEPVEATGI